MVDEQSVHPLYRDRFCATDYLRAGFIAADDGPLGLRATTDLRLSHERVEVRRLLVRIIDREGRYPSRRSRG